MKRRLLINRILALLVCGVMCVSCMMPAAAAPAEEEENAEIRLTEVKGNVAVINGSGREIPYAVDMAPDNGDHVKTQESSYLWMDLGNGSTAKMDAQSGVEFRTSGSKKELLLDEGSLYFNILGEDINIRTTAAALNVQNACGWIRAADREHTLICILSGEGAYSVTDPVDGQVRSEALNSGDLAECLVYPQDQEGDKCDTILRRFGEDDVAGFVLAELAEDPQLLGQIAEASDVDLSSQAEAAQSRLQEEESRLQQKMEELNGKLEEQENNIARDPTWEGGVKPEEEDIAAVEIPFPVPEVESTFEERIPDPDTSASPVARVPEPKNGSDNKPEPQQEERAAMSSEPVADSDNEPEPGQGEDVAAPSEPVTNPGSSSTGPNNSLVVKGVSVNYGAVRVGKDGQAVFKDTFTNEGASNWIENEGQITFEGNLNNEGFAYISNKAQIIAKKDIHNYDSAHIRNRGQIRVEKDVYNGRLESFDRSSIVTGIPGNQFDSRFDVAGKYVGCDASLYMAGGTISEFEQSGGRAYTELYDVSISGVIILRNGSLDIHGGNYIGGEFRIVGGDLTLSDGVRVKTANVFAINAETATQVTIKDAYIDAYFRGESFGGTLGLSIEDGAVISSENPYDYAIIELPKWEEGKCSLNLNGGMIEKKYSEDGNTWPVIWLDTSDGKSYIPDCLSEIHTELKSVPREDLGGIAVAAWIGYLDENYENVGEYTTAWDGNCWRLELINPDGSKASEASVMNEEANPPEDEELTEPETNETLEAENPEEPKDSENEENSEEPKDSEDEENPDESKDPSESEEPSEPKDPSGSEDPKKPAEGGGDESGSGDKETPPDSGDEGGSGDKETPPGSGDALPPENAGDKKEEEPVKDEGAGKEGEAAREQSE